MLPEDIARQGAALVMLGAASCLDLRYRKVSDAVWVASGAISAAFFVIWPSYGVLASCALGTAFGYACLASCTLRQADFLCIAVLSAMVPGLGPAAAVGGVLAASLCAVCATVACNLSELVRGTLFEGVEEGMARKAAAFFLLHRKGRAKYSNKNALGTKFSLVRRQKTSNDTKQDYVYWKVPLIPFFLALLAVLSTLS